MSRIRPEGAEIFCHFFNRTKVSYSLGKPLTAANKKALPEGRAFLLMELFVTA
jgi:hypothetical protein